VGNLPFRNLFFGSSSLGLCLNLLFICYLLLLITAASLARDFLGMVRLRHSLRSHDSLQSLRSLNVSLSSSVGSLESKTRRTLLVAPRRCHRYRYHPCPWTMGHPQRSRHACRISNPRWLLVGNSGPAITVIPSLRIRLEHTLPAILSKCKSSKLRERRSTLLTSNNSGELRASSSSLFRGCFTPPGCPFLDWILGLSAELSAIRAAGRT
jgi:hypothetical protein